MRAKFVNEDISSLLKPKTEEEIEKAFRGADEVDLFNKYKFREIPASTLLKELRRRKISDEEIFDKAYQNNNYKIGAEILKTYTPKNLIKKYGIFLKKTLIAANTTLDYKTRLEAALKAKEQIIKISDEEVALARRAYENQENLYYSWVRKLRFH